MPGPGTQIVFDNKKSNQIVTSVPAATATALSSGHQLRANPSRCTCATGIHGWTGRNTAITTTNGSG